MSDPGLWELLFCGGGVLLLLAVYRWGHGEKDWKPWWWKSR
jgi:hypothetical protein